MTAARLRWWLAILALTLGAAAAIVRVPPRAHASAAPASIYKPPNGC
jgi:hypothetical protein